MQNKDTFNWRITSMTVAVVFVVLLLCSIISYLLLSTWIRSDFDESLLDKAQSLSTLVEQEEDQLELEFSDELMPEFNVTNKTYFYHMLLSNFGEIRELSSQSLKSESLPVVNKKEGKGHYFTTIDMPNVGEVRLVQLNFIPRLDFELPQSIQDKLTNKQTGSIILLGRSLSKVNHILNQVLLTIFVIMCLALFLIVVLVNRVVDKGLQTLDVFSKDINNIEVEALNALTIPEKAPNKLKEVYEQINVLIERLNFSFEREKQFSSDVAHELRTPISEIISLTEVVKKWPDDKELSEEYFDDVLASANRMKRLVSNLLYISRCELGNIQLEHSVFSLLEMIDGISKNIKHELDEKNIQLVVDSQHVDEIQSSRVELEIILNNLMENACQYAEENSSIEMSVYVNQYNQSCLSISNVCNDLTQSDLPKMFNRLWRKDSFSTENNNSGLGLNIVENLCKIMSVSLKADMKDHRFTIRLADLDKAKQSI